MISRLLVTALAASAFSACVQYNEACTAPVDNADAVVAKLRSPIFIDKPNARHANNAFGQVAADAFINAFEGSAQAQLGVINSGALRAEGYCAARNVLRNQIRTSDVYEVLLFDNLLYSLEVTERELVDAMKHSVATVTSAAVPGTPQEIAAPPARLLQVSAEVRMTVDCRLPSDQRLTALTLSGKDILTAPSDTVNYRVALPEYLMTGGDGYSSFRQAYDRGIWSQTSRNEKDAEVVASHLAENYGGGDDAPFLEVEERIRFIDCAIPLPPSAP